MRPIDADALIEKCGDWYVEEGTESGFIGTLKNLLATEPTIQPQSTTGQLNDSAQSTDLIDRQAALNALMDAVKSVGVLDADDIKAVFDMLPTAQPEPQWIPIERELPRDGSWNIFTDGKNISVERYKADAIDHFFPPGRWFQLEDVIAWMPLPTPYTK